MGTPEHDPNELKPTDALLPLLLSLCGIGGFAWGLLRMAQGHHKPGWLAIAINAAALVALPLGYLFGNVLGLLFSR